MNDSYPSGSCHVVTSFRLVLDLDGRKPILISRANRSTNVNIFLGNKRSEAHYSTNNNYRYRQNSTKLLSRKSSFDDKFATEQVKEMFPHACCDFIIQV